MPTFQSLHWDTLSKENLSPQFSRQAVHSESMTMARVYLKQGCSVPEHSHPNEQISIIESGALQFTLEGVVKVARAGDILVIPPNVPHAAIALEDVVGIDIFSPPRQDWIAGTDAYLRK